MRWTRRVSRGGGIPLGLLVAIVLVLGGLVPGALGTGFAGPQLAPVPLPQDLAGGGPGGSTWQVRNNGGTSNGLPTGGICNDSPGLTVEDASLGPLRDAYDHGLILFVNNAIFAPPATVDLTGQTLTAGPVPMSGLNVTMQYFAATSSATLRTLVSFQNPTGSPISVTATWVSNVGSDELTVITGTSIGDTSFTSADRWVITNGDPTDPVNTHVLFGPGSPPVTPSSVSPIVFTCSFSPEGVLATYNVTVPSGATRRLLYFNQLNLTNPEALSNVASFFDANPPPGSELRSGLTDAQLAEVVNWVFP
jgi:hypothetical protein